VGKENYYNYLSKLGFGQYSHIELANEDDWFVEWVSSVSWARYFNNTYGQGLEATPLQVAAWYGSLVNWWYYVKPSIEAGIRDKQTWIFQENKKKVVRQVFRKETSAELKNWLFTIMESNKDYIKNIRVEWFSLWGKSWTSQISYKWRYQQGLWWTNASFVGLLTKNDTRYIVVIQVRRPRTSLWWGETAWRIFRDVAKFLVSYSLIEG
jgi:cell division protein FtsI (penicillin-binding protein 3)